tara:strand:- start:110 stop:679 length:570 start_codon:yes stop_codon:yes gene_type:complete
MSPYQKYEMYKLIHLFGIFLTFVVLGGLGLHVMNGGAKETNQQRKLVAILHGLGVFLILLGGFGTLAYVYKIAGSSQMANGLEPWVMMKLAIWFVLAMGLMLFYRLPKLGLVLFIVLPFLGLTAGYVAIKKPSFGGGESSESASGGGGVGVGSGGSGGSGSANEVVGTQVTYKSSANDVQINKGCACGK